MKKIAILGSTGSIGTNALDVISKNTDKFKVVSLAAGKNIELLKNQIEVFNPRVAAVIDKEHAETLRRTLPNSVDVEIVFGPEGYHLAATLDEIDLVISSMVGAAGLLPTIDAIDAGKDIALANKETMVVAGQIVMEKAAQKGIRILPVDSEHSAIFQCLEGQRRECVKRLILTASGGPFLNMSLEDMRNAKPEEALKHPNWAMGKKITIDSASMMNKGLEVIEAHWLFNIPFENIDVLIHPQSIIHSMVEFNDGSVIAQLGAPDMRIPIAYALSYPHRMHREGPFIDFEALSSLSFSKCDHERFPCLPLAYHAGKQGSHATAVLNAANEIAVEKYLENKIRFTDIPKVLESILAEATNTNISISVDDLMEIDQVTRIKTRNYIEGLVK